MPRAYTIATAAVALRTSIKWLDNVLSHYDVSGVMQKHQGVSRRFTVEGLVVLALAALLIQELGLTTPRAIAVAEDLAKNQGRFAASRGLSLVLDISSFRAELLDRLEIAVEITPVPRRGRPSKTRTGRLV
jgi:hypothetical protein